MPTIQGIFKGEWSWRSRSPRKCDLEDQNQITKWSWIWPWSEIKWYWRSGRSLSDHEDQDRAHLWE